MKYTQYIIQPRKNINELKKHIFNKVDVYHPKTNDSYHKIYEKTEKYNILHSLDNKKYSLSDFDIIVYQLKTNKKSLKRDSNFYLALERKLGVMLTNYDQLLDNLKPLQYYSTEPYDRIYLKDDKYIKYIDSLESVKNVFDSLNQKYNIEITNDNSLIQNIKHSRYHSSLNIRYQYDELKIMTYKVLKNDKSQKYYDYLEDDIYIILEEKTQSLSSNCALLGLELLIERGINKEDIEENNETFIDYMNYIKMYLDL